MSLVTITDRSDMEAAKLPSPLPALRDDARRLQLGSLLLRDGLVTPEQLELALADKEQSGRRLGEIVVENEWVSPAAVAGAIAEQHGLEFVDFAKTQLEPAAAGLLSEK